MSELLYTRTHQWVRVDGDETTLGITPYAAERIGDVVFVELPEINAPIIKGDEAAVIETVKAASEIDSPLSGTVSAINEALDISPALITEAPTGAGWLFKVRIANPAELDELLDSAAYAALLAESA
jgi:glycine cleavage system H protein